MDGATPPRVPGRGVSVLISITFDFADCETATNVLLSQTGGRSDFNVMRASNATMGGGMFYEFVIRFNCALPSILRVMWNGREPG